MLIGRSLKQAKIRIPQKMNEHRTEYLLDKMYAKIFNAMEKTIPKILQTVDKRRIAGSENGYTT